MSYVSSISTKGSSMGLFNQLKQLFSAPQGQISSQTKHDAVDYKGFSITPNPMKEGGQFRVAALIEKTIDDERKQHQFIRSDICVSEEQAVELALQKCRIFIDQMDDQIFESR